MAVADTGGAPTHSLRVRFIAGPVFDSFFFLGSPLLGIAVVLVAAHYVSPELVKSYVLVYMAAGHHVPTFLRAYGDRDEFSRNRTRLVGAPLLLIPLMVYVYHVDARLAALIFVWDQYHFVRQHYGFMRIYDAKIGVRVKSGNNLDQWLCFAAFACIVAHSDWYNYVYADAFYGIGITWPAWLGPLIRQGSLAATGVVGVAYALSLVGRISRGEPVSVLKLVLFATTYGTWYFAYVMLDDAFLSYAISSFFHSLGYEGFAWYYNHAKATSPDAARISGGFFRYVHGVGGLWLFVLAILTYGFVSQVGQTIAPGAILVANSTTGILHYYYDAFIWRVRRTEFRRHLS